MFAMADICSSRLLASPPPAPPQIGSPCTTGRRRQSSIRSGCRARSWRDEAGMWPCDRGDPDQRLTRKVRRLARELW